MIPSGTLCVLYDRVTNKPYAFGLWDENEIIRIKIIEVGTQLVLHSGFWEKRFEETSLKRKQLQEDVTGFRAIHGENDCLPGMILDIYAQVGVLKIYSKIWLPYLEEILPLIQKIYQIETLVLRWNRKLQAQNLPYEEGTVFGKMLVTDKIPFEEFGVSFYAYPIKGHKTGFFLDQRPNRFWVQEHAKGKDVLDVFSYVGGFGIHALKGGAKSLTSIDISEQAMRVAAENLLLNELKEDQWNPIVGDAFEELENLISSNQQFDIAILDPPSFAKQKNEIEKALQQYTRLADLGQKLTKKGGFLVLGSCSSRITLDAFKEAHRQVLSPIEWECVQEVLHDVDHPVVFEEGTYLKTLIYQRI